VRDRQQLTAARAQRILHLRDEQVAPPAIAQRLGVSLITVHRVMRENDESKISVQRPGMASCRSVRAARPESSFVSFFPKIESRRKRNREE